MNQVMPWSSEDSEEEAERWLSSPGCLIQVDTSDKCNILQHHITEEVGNSDIGEVNGPEFVFQTMCYFCPCFVLV